MEKINAVITGVGGYVPDYILTNDEISKMVDTYALKFGFTKDDIMRQIEKSRDYTAVNFYQEANFPTDFDGVLVFETFKDYKTK